MRDHSSGTRPDEATSSMRTGRRVSIARAWTGTPRGVSDEMEVNACHIVGSRRPSANWDMRGNTRSASQRSMEQRSTPQTWAILIATRLRRRWGSRVELRISVTSRRARVSSRLRRVSA